MKNLYLIASLLSTFVASNALALTVFNQSGSPQQVSLADDKGKLLGRLELQKSQSSVIVLKKEHQQLALTVGKTATTLIPRQYEKAITNKHTVLLKNDGTASLINPRILQAAAAKLQTPKPWYIAVKNWLVDLF